MIVSQFPRMSYTEVIGFEVLFLSILVIQY
jgi:hypothetical protein